MMGCGSEDDVRWMAKAEENPLLVAAELYFLAHPAARVTWRCILKEAEREGFEDSPLFPFSRPRSPPRIWGRKGLRWKARVGEAAAAAAREEKDVWSPTTPLSWSGGSASSSGGGGCEKGEGQKTGSGGEGGRVGGSGGDAPVGGSVIKMETPGAEDRVAVEILVAAKRRQCKKKMTLAELKDCESSLLAKRTELQKEMEEQRAAHRLLLEENERLRKSRLKLQLREVAGPTGACMVAEAKIKKCRCLPFDLNLSLPEELDAAD